MYIVYLGIGGNRGSRLQNIEFALKGIQKYVGEVLKTSSLYLSEPWGYTDNEYYLNAVVKVQTKLKPQQLLKTCLSIEEKLLRTRCTEGGYCGRTMDIDILLYSNIVLNQKKLRIPHPGIEHRKFVLLPLAEIFPTFIHPVNGKSAYKLVKQCTDTGKIRKLKCKKRFE